jgi:hypothetical protein
LLYHKPPPLVKTLAQGSSAIKAEFEEYNFMGTRLTGWCKSTSPSEAGGYVLLAGEQPGQAPIHDFRLRPPLATGGTAMYRLEGGCATNAMHQIDIATIHVRNAAPQQQSANQQP